MMQRVNKFYVLIGALVLVLVAILVLSIRTVISAYMTSTELERGERLVTVDRQELNEVYNWSFNRETVLLNIEDIGAEQITAQEESEEEINEEIDQN